LSGAKAFLRSFEAEQRSTAARAGRIHEAELLPHLFNYLREHGPDVKRLDTVKSSFRAWIGFLMHDSLDTNATIADITPAVAALPALAHGAALMGDRRGAARHSAFVEGVTGLTVQRNIEDLAGRAQPRRRRTRFEAPKVPSVDKKLRRRSAAKLPTKTLGALSAMPEDEGVYRELALMLGTLPARRGAGVRSDAMGRRLIDLQPDGRPLTDKRNAIVPVIEPLKPILEAWKEKPHPKVASRKRWWRTARRALASATRPMTSATRLRPCWTTAAFPAPDQRHHRPHPRKPQDRPHDEQALPALRPAQCPQAKRALTKFFKAVDGEADKWAADHLRTKPAYKKPIEIDRKLENARVCRIFGVVGGVGLEPTAFSV
jgi:hypothetical protein